MHVYQGVDGRPLPSVSHIVRETKPLSELIRFQKSKQKKMEEKGWTEHDWEVHCDRAKNRGSLVHSYVEWYLPLASQNTVSLDKSTESIMRTWEGYDGIGCFVRQFNRFICDLGIQTEGDWELVELEEKVIHDEMGYGGRYDFRLRIGDQIHLFDIKTNMGYYSKWKNKQVYEWDEWRRPKSIPIEVEKEYKNGKMRMVKAKDENGKALMEKETLPPEKERGWEWVSSFVEDYYLQLCLYILAIRDEQKRGNPTYSDGKGVDCANLLVLFPERYQLIRLPASVWSGCKKEAINRVNLFYRGHHARWYLEQQFAEKEDIRDLLSVQDIRKEHISSLLRLGSEEEEENIKNKREKEEEEKIKEWSLPELPF